MPKSETEKTLDAYEARVLDVFHQYPNILERFGPALLEIKPQLLGLKPKIRRKKNETSITSDSGK